MKQAPASSQNRGLTLVEVLVSMTLLVGLASMSMNVIPLTKLNRNATSDQTATLAVKQYMETVASNWKTQATFDAGTLPSYSNLITDYTCTVQVTDPDNIAAPSKALRKRLTLSCTKSGSSSLNYVAEYARPTS
ncbi:type IV pilus modification PilV family protein [Deinococcus roseus]|uniref:Prepilin-type cleavage/methylation domain-containing protein n=1 Tax=Deinococcus roseus TaxID=392414 RepID=A0ABQ2CZG4_9DEIO|nr:prepilin-type N-terminal cleavage/methylation domain-containing protein [Deinococcus roseus]GGJ35756.1 hypothetical protein GCM10008938_22350 [Deinococcus roseus]